MTHEQAIDIFKHITTIIPSQDVTMDDVDTAMDMAISALQDRPIGHWEIYQSSNRNVIACSCCKQPIYEPHMNYYYCPTCGAKME